MSNRASEPPRCTSREQRFDGSPGPARRQARVHHKKCCIATKFSPQAFSHRCPPQATVHRADALHERALA
jgi:hypothetical protein